MAARVTAAIITGRSAVGVTVALTAPGVAMVSTIFRDQWGVMSGTSMATPIDTGVLARRLAADVAVLGMPRDSARCRLRTPLSIRSGKS
jgi:subtilisin family serine protease